jgi:hypothetical protein
MGGLGGGLLEELREGDAGIHGSGNTEPDEISAIEAIDASGLLI